MALKVLNPSTKRYNSFSSLDKPMLQKITKKVTGHKVSPKLTKVELWKKIKSKCSSIGSSTNKKVTHKKTSTTKQKTTKKNTTKRKCTVKVKSHRRKIC